MRRSGWTPSIVPNIGDQNVYLVLDCFDRAGCAWREADAETTDLETVISDLMSGQYNDPRRVVAFNIYEHWAEDVSEDIAREIRRARIWHTKICPHQSRIRHPTCRPRAATQFEARLMSWDRQFSAPLAYPKGRLLITLRDAATYISGLSAAEQQLPAWQTAVHVLIQAADHGGPVEFARIGMTKALFPRGTPVYHSVDRDPEWRNNYKLVRDQ